MFCPKCGNQLPDGSAFCGKCGVQLGQSKTAAPTARVSSASPGGSVSPASIAAAGLAARAGIFFWSGKKKKTQR